MIHVRHKCENCLHEHVCKHNGYMNSIAEELKEKRYRDVGPCKQTWEDISEWHEFTISFSCNNYRDTKYTGRVL